MWEHTNYNTVLYTFCSCSQLVGTLSLSTKKNNKIIFTINVKTIHVDPKMKKAALGFPFCTGRIYSQWWHRDLAQKEAGLCFEPWWQRVWKPDLRERLLVSDHVLQVWGCSSALANAGFEIPSSARPLVMALWLAPSVMHEICLAWVF